MLFHKIFVREVLLKTLTLNSTHEDVIMTLPRSFRGFSTSADGESLRVDENQTRLTFSVHLVCRPH